MKNILFVLLVAVSSSLFAQTPEKKIEKQYLTMSQLMIDRKSDQALNYINENIFELLPKAQMKMMMESLFNNSSIEYKAKLPTILEIEPIKKIDGSYYAKLKTENIILMKILPDSAAEPKSATAQEAYDQNLFSTFKKKYGDANVIFDSKTGFYTVTATKYAVANSKDQKNWKFIVIDNERMKPLLEKFIPKEMLE